MRTWARPIDAIFNLIPFAPLGLWELDLGRLLFGGFLRVVDIRRGEEGGIVAASEG